MTAKIAEFKAAERALAMQFRAFEEMKQDPELKKALEFDTALDELLAKFKMSRSALYELLGYDIKPDQKPTKKPAKKPTTTPAKKPAVAHNVMNRRTPIMKTREYKNPHTGEEIVVGGNRHGVFNAWNLEFGKDVVHSWMTAEYPSPQQPKRSA